MYSYSETTVEASQLASTAGVMSAQGYCLFTMVATDERAAEAGAFVLRYVFRQRREPDARLVAIRAVLRSEDLSVASVTPVLSCADWYEREAADMFGIRFTDHPDLRPLVNHGCWPDGVFPLRKDVPAATPVERPSVGQAAPVDAWLPRFDNSADMEVPVGPIHAGIIEPGHFRFATIGEDIYKLEARLFYTHRGIEKAVEGLSPQEGLFIAERICGACAASHAVAYAQAVEMALGLMPSRRTRYLRVLIIELERLYNHIGDFGNICAGVGYAFGISQMAILKEHLLRMNEVLTGNRFLRGFVSIHQADIEPDKAVLDGIAVGLPRIIQRFRDIAEAVFDSDSFVDRADTTGVLPHDEALRLGAVGIAARASGVSEDVRRCLPHAAYPEFEFDVITADAGDVLARMKVRFGEVFESAKIIGQVLEGLPDADASDTCASALGVGIGVVESPRGSDVHWICLDSDGRIDRLRVRSASYCNWPAVAVAAPGNIIPDFPLINKSFELCYSCLDR